MHNDKDAVAVGLNYMGGIGDVSVALSAGHYVASQTLPDPSTMIFDGTTANGDNPRMRTSDYTAGQQRADAAAIKAFDEVVADGGIATDAVRNAAREAKANMAKYQVPMSKVDEHTFTNFGLQVGIGAFSFDVAYAMHDGGAYKPMRRDVVANDNSAVDDPDTDANETDPNGVRSVLVKDGAKDYEVASVGAMYSDGPMSVSLSYMMAEDDAGGEASTAMLSGSYTLAPGIAWKTSVFAGEQDTAASGETDGTAFVTGITLNF